MSRADNDNLLPSPPKRNRLDKNIKESKPNKESEQSEQGLPIQCPICLESLDEVNNLHIWFYLLLNLNNFI